MLSSTFICHISAPRFYHELKDQSVPRFNRLVALGFGSSIVIAGIMAAIGFATFGAHCSGFVLNNYAPSDMWIGFSRLAVTASILFSYPLAFQGLRDGALETLGIPVADSDHQTLNRATITLLFFLTVVATQLTDVSGLVALNGATLGNMLAYIMPAVMYGSIEPSAKIPAAILGSLGVVLAIVGSALAFQKLQSK